MAVLLYLLRDCGIWMSLSFTVFAFGLGISFLGMLSTLILGALLWLGLAAFSGSGGSNGSRGNIIIEDYDGTYEAYEHGFGIYKDVTGSGQDVAKGGFSIYQNKLNIVHYENDQKYAQTFILGCSAYAHSVM